MTIDEIPTTWEEVASELPRSATDTQRLMLAVLYRFQTEGAETVDITAIQKDLFFRARWPRPSNLAATANYCASQGWLSSTGTKDGRKHWRITRKGHSYITRQVNGGQIVTN